jgi:hypothetical protein
LDFGFWILDFGLNLPLNPDFHPMAQHTVIQQHPTHLNVSCVPNRDYNGGRLAKIIKCR